MFNILVKMLKKLLVILTFVLVIISFNVYSQVSQCTDTFAPVCAVGTKEFITGQKIDGCELDHICGLTSIPRITAVEQDQSNFIVKTESQDVPATPEDGYLVEYWYGTAQDEPFVSLNNYAYEGGDSPNGNAKRSLKK